MKNLWRLFFLLFAGVGCIVLFGLLLLYANYVANQAAPTFPLVTITSTFPDGAGVVNRPVVVFGEAGDPDGIENVELWVNGQRVASQVNPDQNLHSFSTSQSWIPDGLGSYLIYLRGVDKKGFAGQSQPVLLQVGERSYQSDPALHGQYIVQEGDTIENIAGGLGTTPEEIGSLNPGVGDLSPGDSLEVPGRPEGEAGGDGAPPPADGEEPPHVPPPAPAPAGDGIPAIIAAPPLWTLLPIPGSWACLIQPELCAAPHPTGGGSLPLAPAFVTAALTEDGCQVSVSWTDNSTDEVGFRVYRLTNRPRFRMDALALLSSSPGTGTRLTYTDTPPASPASPYYYLVETYNSAGQIWSALSEPITPVCPEGSALHPSERALAVEALEMTVRDSYDRLYCYVSLAGSPFERIPHGASEFIQMDSGAWNIADYASGRNKRAIIANGSRPLNIIVECLGWQGDTLVNLGRFTRSHPPEEWDGRLLTAGPDDGSFSVTYRIEPTEEAYGHGGGGDGAWPLIDPHIPAPFDLRRDPQWVSCSRSVEDLITCAWVDEPGLAWEYTVFEGTPRPPLFYRVYKRLEGESAPRVYFDTIGSDWRRAPLDDTGQRVFYSVSAVVGTDPVTGEEIQSPFSEELEVPPLTGTGMLEITLVDLMSYYAPYNAYGSLAFNGVLVIWNLGPCPGDTLCGGAPAFTTLRVRTANNWADMYLSVNRGSWGRSHNVFQVPIHSGEALRWGLDLYEFTDESRWCGFLGGTETLLAARSLSDWLAVDQDVAFHVPSDGSSCGLTFHVRGLPGTP